MWGCKWLLTLFIYLKQTSVSNTCSDFFIFSDQFHLSKTMRCYGKLYNKLGSRFGVLDSWRNNIFYICIMRMIIFPIYIDYISNVNIDYISNVYILINILEQLAMMNVYQEYSQNSWQLISSNSNIQLRVRFSFIMFK